MIKVNFDNMVDLTHLMTNEMPVFPGSDAVILKKAANVTTDGFNELKLTISGHTGTHVDCGRHIFDGGFDTSSIPPEQFTGSGVLIDCREAGSSIDKSWLRKHEHKIRNTHFLLMHTGWDRYWKSEQYFKDFPSLTVDAADYLKTFALKGIGVDAPSFDPADSKDLPVHHTLLSEGIVLIENLTNLDALIHEGFLFCCLPLKIKDGDGSPVRAVAIY